MSKNTNAHDVDGEGAPNGTGASAAEVAAFTGTVGKRIRQLRARRRMSRREVSELSGVSQRYLAQLESGEGNISIALLYRVAHALGHHVGAFLVYDDAAEPEAAEFTRLFLSADSLQRRRVRDILVGESSHQTRKRRISLIGVRGAGKSTLGKLVADAMSMSFMELNSDIEEQSGMPVEEVIALYGPEGFRELERQALERLVATTHEGIVAVAGGIVSEPQAYDFLLRHFHTIWLKATPEEHMMRVRAQGDQRPMAGNPKALEELQSILTSREALYARADKTVNTSGKTVAESVQDVLEAIEKLDNR